MTRVAKKNACFDIAGGAKSSTNDHIVIKKYQHHLSQCSHLSRAFLLYLSEVPNRLGPLEMTTDSVLDDAVPIKDVPGWSGTQSRCTMGVAHAQTGAVVMVISLRVCGLSGPRCVGVGSLFVLLASPETRRSTFAK